MTTPSASMVAVSPRSCCTLPTIRTVLEVKWSRWGEEMRGVECGSAIFEDVVFSFREVW